MEELLVSADVGMATSSLLVERSKERVKSDGASSTVAAIEALKDEMVNLLSLDRDAALLEPSDGPLAILMIGVNGAGKTTSIAKLVHLFRQRGSSVVVGAADTFRAAAVEQLEAWGQQLDVDVISGQPGADPGAVAFDTIEAAKARGADIVVIDTAGRLHTKVNLLEELKKVGRVVSRQVEGTPPRVLLTLDATTGQNGLLQARAFVDAMKCDGVFLSKLDGTAKGGVVLAIANELKLPVLFIGTGESVDDIAAFEPNEYVAALFRPD